MEELQQQIDMLKTAHQRLFNQYNNLANDFSTLLGELTNVKAALTLHKNYFDKQLYEISITQPRPKFQDGMHYVDRVSQIVSFEGSEVYNKVMWKINLKLEGRPEIYEIFVQQGNEPKVSDRISFTFQQKDNKLTKMKILP